MKNTLILILIFICSSNGMTQVDTTKNIIDKTKIQIKLSDAKNKFYSRNYPVSINLYREVLAIQKKQSKSKLRNSRMSIRT